MQAKDILTRDVITVGSTTTDESYKSGCHHTAADVMTE